MLLPSVVRELLPLVWRFCRKLVRKDCRAEVEFDAEPLLAAVLPEVLALALAFAAPSAGPLDCAPTAWTRACSKLENSAAPTGAPPAPPGAELPLPAQGRERGAPPAANDQRLADWTDEMALVDRIRSRSSADHRAYRPR